MGNTLMCPSCDQNCPFWKLRDSCTLARVTYMFDNWATVIFTVFMSFWGKDRRFSYFKKAFNVSRHITVSELGFEHFDQWPIL